jgi:hypothetical protein
MMLNRICGAPEQSFFLLGPRGTGKGTWLRAAFPDAYVIDLLSEEIYQRLLANPGHFAGELRSVPDGRWVVVDEVQRLPNLLNEVHRFIEEKRLHFVLCGSSARNRGAARRYGVAPRDQQRTYRQVQKARSGCRGFNRFQGEVLDGYVGNILQRHFLAHIQDFDADEMPVFVNVQGNPFFDINVIIDGGLRKPYVQGIRLSVVFDPHNPSPPSRLLFYGRNDADSVFFIPVCHTQEPIGSCYPCIDPVPDRRFKKLGFFDCG